MFSEDSAQFDYCPGCGGQGELDIENSPCFKTQQGCQCETTWEYGLANMLIGCQNPDNDARGLWCQVQEDCAAYDQLEHIRGASGLESGAKFDYCSPGCTEPIGAGTTSNGCDRTVTGCQCLPRWTYKGQNFQGCVFLNDGPPGPFCSIISGSCELGEPSGKITDPVTGAVIQEMDFCFPHCIDASNTDLSFIPLELPSDEEYQAAGVCLRSKNGCECHKSWLHDSNADSVSSLYYGCSSTMDREVPWCYITDPASCTSPPAHSTWDDCSGDCIQSLVSECTVTDNGCACKNVWEFEGLGVIGCARPDSFPKAKWCEVDPSSCSPDSVTSIGGITGDYCSQTCA
eukprot:TRINITY_DN16406_c0_g2_i1.p1 TRINITY_DN16406_c0_g2~~TRINITY_DN16406_c0_g2_i1.p1  ORF type:complete len:344 (-),score=27.15 TRINITY_DN16406_c0_g2_i1:360-1391(-)